MRPENYILRQVPSDACCGGVVASSFAICISGSGVSDAQNGQNARYYFC